MMTDIISSSKLSGRNRRLLHEWQALEELNSRTNDWQFSVRRYNADGLPTAYTVVYSLLSICGVASEDFLKNPEVLCPPIFAKGYVLHIDIPEAYPCADAQPSYYFQTTDDKGIPIPHPWHPNIRYYGAFAGRVCVNSPDTFTSIAWAVERIAHYLRYDSYHCRISSPYPEDLKVAQWVREQGETYGWVFFNQS